MKHPPTRRYAVAALALVCLAFPRIAEAEDEVSKLRASRNDLELQVERLKRDIPLPASASELREMLARVAERAELDLVIREISAPERLELIDGKKSPIELVRVGISGKDRFGDLAFFLSTLRYGGRQVQLESLQIVAERDDSVRFSARLAFPHYAGGPGESAQWGGRNAIAVLRDQVESLSQLRDLLLAASVQRRRAENTIEALALLTNSAQASPISLREVRLERELVLEGFAVGAAARAALSRALETARIEVTKFDMPSEGLCRAFVITAQLADATETSDAVVGDNGLFDPTIPPICTGAERGTFARVMVRGTANDGITVKLRDSDLAGAFMTLSQATGESFVIDFDLTGRLQLFVEKATLDETIAALRHAGIEVGPPPLRLVTRKGRVTPATEGDFAGEPLSISLQHADLPSVLCIFSNITGLTIRMPPGLARDVSIFANEVAWDRVLEGLLAAQGMSYELRDGVIVAGTQTQRSGTPANVDSCETSSASPPASRFSRFTLDQLESGDLLLQGVARMNGEWMALVEMPGGRLQSFQSGQELSDGRVGAIDESGLTIVGADGTKRRVTFNADR
ncbi:MAG: hypothetical protein HYU52_06395 [Acidobacteria bacterium]|nr:hypothetical protein [Acidobacteriota bacterium]